MLILDIKTRWSSTHQMLHMSSYFHTHFILSTYISKVMRLIIAKSSMTLLQRHRIFTTMSLHLRTGVQSSLSHTGLRHFVQPQHRCQWQSIQCYHLLKPFSVVCRSLYLNCQIIHRLVSRIHSSRHIRKWVTITPSLMSRHCTYGPLVSCFLTSIPRFQLIYWQFLIPNFIWRSFGWLWW